MRIEPRDPRTFGWHYGPVQHFHVIFWRQPHVPPEQLPEGVTQDRVMWAASEYDIVDARDVVAALHWAEEEARKRSAIFTLNAVVDRGRERDGLVWLAGWDPTVNGANFEDRQPPDMNPSTGTVAEVFSPPDV